MRFSTLALVLLGHTASAQMNPQAKSDSILLEAIAQVESGGKRTAVGKAGERGAYQMKPVSWSEANDLLKLEGHYFFAWSHWRDATAQDMTAAAFVRVIRRRFAHIGIADPTAEQIAVVWNMGWTAAHRGNFPVTGYASRVGNIFRLAKR